MPLTRPLAVLECLLASALTFALLGLPLWLPAWRPSQQLFAVLWVLQQLWVVLAFGCTSVFARVLSIYPTQVRAEPGCLSCSAAVMVLAAACHAFAGAQAVTQPCPALHAPCMHVLSNAVGTCAQQRSRWEHCFASHSP